MTGPGEPNDPNGGWAGGPIPGLLRLRTTAFQVASPPRELPPPGPADGGSASPGPHASAFFPEPSAWTSLLTAVPWFFWSLVLVIWIAGAIGFGWGWIVIVLWVLSGAVIFVAPAEPLFARYLFRLRQPTLIEQERLGPIWHQLLQHAEVRDGRLSLWIQESDEVNATPTPGHMVAVTRWALYTLPPSHLEAVLAHELGHHLGGRSWLSMLSFWYSIPARCGLIVSPRRCPTDEAHTRGRLHHRGIPCPGLHRTRPRRLYSRARVYLASPVPDAVHCTAFTCMAESLAGQAGRPKGSAAGLRQHAGAGPVRMADAASADAGARPEPASAGDVEHPVVGGPSPHARAIWRDSPHTRG